MNAYLADPVHAGWRFHYTAFSYSPAVLVFTSAWADQWLPSSLYNPKALKLVLKDTLDGRLYDTWISCAYQHRELNNLPGVLDTNWDVVEGMCLMPYFYSCHHCPCHRKQDAKAAGADVPDDECEGTRFLIHEIVAPALPRLVLYSETRTPEELEELLNV
jgi:hypothetical protein